MPSPGFTWFILQSSEKNGIGHGEACCLEAFSGSKLFSIV